MNISFDLSQTAVSHPGSDFEISYKMNAHFMTPILS